jgi:Zn-dependent protease with chaperone function/type II secretory pathway pseudopilin PulG
MMGLRPGCTKAVTGAILAAVPVAQQQLPMELRQHCRATPCSRGQASGVACCRRIMPPLCNPQNNHREEKLDPLVYPRERTLGKITLVIGVLFWALMVLGTLGLALIYLLFFFVIYLFAQSALISYVKGNGVALSREQFPDLHQRFEACCDKLGISDQPEAYVLMGDGMFNAFATRFLGRHYVLLLSNVVDALEDHPDGVNFYIGHELGHIRMKHFTGHFWRWPALWIPLLGAAYARAQESTCDRHGAACSTSPQHAAHALAAIAAGERRWRTINLTAFGQQVQSSSGFWMSYHELTSGYPWTSKRVARVLNPDAVMPSRSTLAFVLAAFVPYAGRLGGVMGPLILVAVIGILAAVAIPAYQDYTVRAKVAMAYQNATLARNALGAHYAKTQTVPDSLREVGINPEQADGSTLELNTENMALTVLTPHGELLLTPSDEGNGKISWACTHGIELRRNQVPEPCRGKKGGMFDE